MSTPARKIISGRKMQNLPRLTDASQVGVAEVSRLGVVKDINYLGKKLLGWKINDRLSAPIATAIKALPDGSPQRLPVGPEGVYVVGVSKGAGKGCLLFGFDTNRSGDDHELTRVVNEIPVAITRSNRKGIVEFANRYARKFLGRDPVGSSLWREIVLEADHWKLDEAIRQLAEVGKASTRVRYTDVSGMQRTAILYFSRADEHSEDGYIDIAGVDSEDDFNFDKTFASDAIYKTFVEQSPIGIVLFDSNGTVVMENHPLRLIIGEGPEDAWIGRHYSELEGLGDDFKPCMAEMLAGISSFSIQDIEYASASDDFFLTLRGSPIVQEDGDVTGGVVLVEDRTQQKEAERIIEAARQEAIRSSERKAAFISTMSHELRTPLGTINGFSEMLAAEIAQLADSGAPVPDVVIEFANAIQERASEVLVLVDDLFDMALIDSGMLTLDRAPLDIAELAGRVHGEVQGKFNAKGIELNVNIKSPPPVIEGDAKRLEQVLRILLDNALKFTDEGCVDIVVAGSQDNTAILRVEDTGIGIDDSTLESIFDPMVQGDTRLNRAYEGAGVGLAMVDRVVSLMGGSVTASNRTDGGSVFKVELGGL